MRYNEIQKAIPQATAKMLSQQLKELEGDGIIRRKLYPVVPPKTEYSLTELGKKTFEKDRGEYLLFADSVKKVLEDEDHD